MFDLFKKIYVTVDNARESVEDFMADDILKRWDELKNVDDLRKAGELFLKIWFLLRKKIIMRGQICRF